MGSSKGQIPHDLGVYLASPGQNLHVPCPMHPRKALLPRSRRVTVYVLKFVQAKIPATAVFAFLSALVALSIVHCPSAKANTLYDELAI